MAKTNEDEIHELFEQWKESLRKKDFAALIKDYAPNFSCFDIKENVEGPEAYKNLWEQCAPYFNEPIPEYKDLKLEVTDNMAVMYGFSRMTGMNLPPEMENSPLVKSWIRLTIVYQKTDGAWRVLHEHASYPVDCENERPVYILDEADQAA